MLRLPASNPFASGSPPGSVLIQDINPVQSVGLAEPKRLVLNVSNDNVSNPGINDRV